MTVGQHDEKLMDMHTFGVLPDPLYLPVALTFAP